MLLFGFGIVGLPVLIGVSFRVIVSILVGNSVFRTTVPFIIVEVLHLKRLSVPAALLFFDHLAVEISIIVAGHHGLPRLLLVIHRFTHWSLLPYQVRLARKQGSVYALHRPWLLVVWLHVSIRRLHLSGGGSVVRIGLLLSGCGGCRLLLYLLDEGLVLVQTLVHVQNLL
jgi:hypothetical protein